MNAQQIGLFAHDLPARTGPTLEFWPGFSWSVGRPEVAEWGHGWVTTPKYTTDRRLRGAVILDNGAFPAWRDGVSLSAEDMFSTMAESIERMKPARVSWAISPDIVGGGLTSWRRSVEWAPRLQDLGVKVLLPVQEGIPFELCTEDASELGAGLFIGGATRDWKFYATRRIRELDQNVRIHVGRISLAHHLERVCGLADSFDCTYWCRGQTNNMKRDFREIIPYLKKPGGEQCSG